ncbi:Phage integrase family protein [Symmachiella macrocystis]|uniref:Phage integrase family protein n=1 Tax=Symmachiella macrocystis TaxID=2527985 RepID=A0A5C6BT73_9PLAN|nr:tyrosine-type recombinase/integrase [Symmachiella macrocystis]TWU13894.1 Phage integrase family protein [Symmachiella macrocystis]
MPKSPSLRVPSYRCHKPTGQAVVNIYGRDLYLGKWNTAASRNDYDRLIAELLANGRRLQCDADVTVVEVLNAYRKFAEGYYRESVKQWQERLTDRQRAELDQWKSDHRWSPNRLRHSAGTEIRKRYGLEAAQVILGHASADVTQVYAERDLQKAVEIMREVG